MTTINITVSAAPEEPEEPGEPGELVMASSITVGDITVTLDGTYPVGTDLAGQKYIVAPSGVRVTAASPTKTTVSGRLINGEMRTPQRDDLAFQALDSGGGLPGYDASMAADLSQVIPVNDALIKVKSRVPLTNGGREGMWEQIAGFHVVAEAKPATALAPYVWPAGDLANRPWREADVDGLLSLITQYTSVDDEVPWANLKARYSKLTLGRAFAASAAPGGYEYCGTFEEGSQSGSNYDRYMVELQSAVLAGLMGNTWSTQDRTEAIIALLQKGCQWGEAANAFAIGYGPDGGQYLSQYAPAMAWLKATGRESLAGAWTNIMGGNGIHCYFYVPAGMFDPHSDPDKPYIARRRTVLSITGSGPYQVLCTGYRGGSGLAGDTSSNGVLAGNNMIRESNGATALITAQTESGADWLLTVAALPTGLSVGNTIYCGPALSLPVGAAEYSIRSPITYPNLPNPSPQAAYRDLQFPAIEHLFVSNIRMSHALAQPAKDYCVRAQTAGSGLPNTAARLGGTELAGYWNNAVGPQFWTAHSAAILALPQIV